MFMFVKVNREIGVTTVGNIWLDQISPYLEERLIDSIPILQQKVTQMRINKQKVKSAQIVLFQPAILII